MQNSAGDTQIVRPGIGSSRGVIGDIMAAEVLAVIVTSSLIAALLTVLVLFYGTDLIRGFLLN